MKKWIGAGINSDLKDSVNNNVLNVVRALVEDKDSVVYIPNEYQNGSTYRTSSDPAVHFLPTECGKSIKVIGLQSNQERFNFSMIGLVDVIVEYPQEDGTVDLKDKKIFRQYNIIRDGELAMDYVSAKLSFESFDALKKIGILYYNGLIVPENHKHNPDYVYKIVLKDLPLISNAWAQPNRIGLVRFMKREAELCGTVKTLKKLMSEYKNNGISITPDEKESDIYSEKYGESTKVEKKPKEVDCLVYSLNLPDYEYSIEDARDEYPDINSLNNKIKEINKELRYVRFIIRCMVYSIEGTKKMGGFEWSELNNVPRSKVKMYQTAEIVVDNEKYVLTRTVYKKKI